MPEITDALSGINLSDAMEKLMAHPEILQLAASVLNTGDEKVENRNPEEETKEETAPAALLPIEGKHAEERSHRHGKKERSLDGTVALLIALKPYLSKKRCETVDRLIDVGKIGRVISEFL